MAAERLRVHRLTGLGAADLDVVPAARRAAELVIESQHAIDFGARAIERVGDHRERQVGDVAELMLQIVEDLQQLVRAVAMRCANFARAFLATGGSFNDYF